MKKQLICAVDIGTSKVATVVALFDEEEDKIPKIIGFSSSPSLGIKKGLVIDIEKATEAIEKSIEKAEKMAGYKIDKAFVSVGGPHISSLNSHGLVAITNPNQEINESDVIRVIEAAQAVSLSSTRQIIEVVPCDFTVDGQGGIKNPVGMTGVRLEVDTHIITASQTNIKNIQRCLSDLGIEIEGFVFSGLSSAEAVLTDTEKELGVVLVDIGGGKTDLCLYSEGSLLHSSSLPIGGKHVTNDMAVGLRVSLDSAEKIKIYLSKKMNNLSMKKKISEIDLSELKLQEDVENISIKTLIDEIINPRLEEIFKLIYEEIEKSGLIKSIPSGLVLTGGGALTIGIMDVAKKVIGLPVRVGVPEKVGGLVDEILNPSYATTIGLILVGKNKIQKESFELKSFRRIWRDFSTGFSIEKLKNFFKQFIP
jgi:cell division protein FtsA